MSRLTYSSLKAYVRSLQVSRIDIFVFVEGWSDRYLYDRICAGYCPQNGAMHEVRTAAELPGQTGGKQALLDFLTHLRRRKLLSNEFKGKRTLIAFFLDKDIDDYTRSLKHSNHVTYTQFYEIENHLIRQSNLADIVAAAASLDVGSIRAGMGDESAWAQRAAEEWKEWVKLCVGARVSRSNVETNYGVPSRVNNGPYGGLLPNAAAQRWAELERASGLQPAEFQRLSGRVRRHVDRAYAAGNHDSVFKGKWYTLFLAEDVRRIAGPRPYNANGLEECILALARAKTDIAAGWADGYRRVLGFLIALLRD